MKSVIETQDLGRRYGHQDAVDGLNLQVPEGSIFAFLGPNGAGKTTTIKMLMNIVAPSRGEARILGRKTTELRPEDFTRIGYVSENQKMPDWMTVRQFVDYCQPMYPKWDSSFSTQLVESFGLPWDRKLKHLSRGMRMKASLMSSLAYRPDLLILDEPFTGLDPLVRDEVIRGMLENSEQAGRTVFVSSHDIDEVERLADWVGILNGGKLQLAESVESLQRRFRRVDGVLPSAGRIPLNLPKSWLLPERTEHTVRLVESQYVAEATESGVSAAFPGITEINVTEMSLREIFMTLARTYRLKP